MIEKLITKADHNGIRLLRNMADPEEWQQPR
jgi:hypothetical protein